MTKVKSIEVNCTTGEVIETPYTAAELAELPALEAKWEAEAQARRDAKKAEEKRIADLKESAKTKLVAGEPLTEEEASVLVI
jgi:predicted secreted protein